MDGQPARAAAPVRRKPVAPTMADKRLFILPYVNRIPSKQGKDRSGGCPHRRPPRGFNLLPPVWNPALADQKLLPAVRRRVEPRC